MTDRQHDRLLAWEASEEREARLHHVHQRNRLAVETTEERGARLQQMSACQCADWHLRLPRTERLSCNIARTGSRNDR